MVPVLQDLLQNVRRREHVVEWRPELREQRDYPSFSDTQGIPSDRHLKPFRNKYSAYI
jgi:hypothetical protein